MSTEDPSFWKTAAEYGWLLLGAPIAYVWKKATNSVGHNDLRQVAEEAKTERTEIKTMVRTLFANAEEDRRREDEKFNKVIDKIHAVHMDLRDRIEQK